MALTKTQTRLLRKIRSKLDTKDPDFQGSEVIRSAFTPGIPDHNETPSTFARSFDDLKKTELYMSCGLYLHSWVIPLIDELLEGANT